MAGDVGIHEVAIVGGVGAPDVGELVALVAEEGGEATHRYGPRVLIAAISPEGARVVERLAPGVTVAAEPGAIPEAARGGLDEVEALGLDAFALRQSDEEYAASKARRPLAGESWDSGEALAPDLPAPEEFEVPEAEAVPTGARLNGRVAVGIIIVEGPTAALQFTQAERTNAVAEVQNGLTWLGSLVLSTTISRVTWVYDIQTVELTVNPNPADTTWEQREARWRDPALDDLGFDPGHAGVRAYVEDLRTRLGTDSAYCGFFTRYPLGHFAYVPSIGGPHLVMHYDNDGWGPANIDRVFAHETGHIFGAPDEYASSGCDCGGQWGFCRRPNTNCQNCAPGGGVPCIMRSNDWAMCRQTPFHLGFNVKVPHASEMSRSQAFLAMRDVCLQPNFTGQHGPGAWVYMQRPSGGDVPPFSTVTMRLTTRTRP